MDVSATIPYGDSDEHTCDYCGAVIATIITKQTAHNEREEYYCPECKKEYSAKASMPIRVQLVSPRTDGRTDRYPS
jgi:predicted RNA-binding Zn-ribbon protein involved in translation (DUF1610 family)